MFVAVFRWGFHGAVRARSLCAVFAAMGLASAQAAGVYAGIGLPGVTLGFALPVAESVTLRADFTSVGTRTATRVESGISYDARLKADRIGAFVDWFAFGGRFRLTAGMTGQDTALRLGAFGAGRVVTIGSNSYTLQASDRFDADIAFPRSMPYLGIGWGHRGGATGLGFHADIGAAIGRPTVTTRASGNLASASTIAADIAQEEAQLRENLRRVRAIPQLSLGVDYRY
jgi:hypothetical protein